MDLLKCDLPARNTPLRVISTGERVVFTGETLYDTADIDLLCERSSGQKILIPETDLELLPA